MMRLAAISLAAAFLTGCDLSPAVADLPHDCAAEFPSERCLAIADGVAAEVERDRGDVTAVTIVPDSPPEGAVLGGPWPIRIRLTFDDGTTHESRICRGVDMSPSCSDEPELTEHSVKMGGGGYQDVPCAGEPPDGCASPHPSVEPAAAASAEPLTIDALTIPIDHEGAFEVVLGEGSLPNGILSEASFAFEEGWPLDVAIADGAGRLDVRSLEPDGRPFDNYYLHGWRRGVERVEAVLLFDVLWFEPGAELGIRDVIVR